MNPGGSGLLFLMLCTVLSQVQHCQPQAVDFVCNTEARKRMNIAPKIEMKMKNCSEAEKLPVTIQLPCTKLHFSWRKKSVQEKGAFVGASLQFLTEALKAAVVNEQKCQAIILELLMHNIQNHLYILRDLKIQWESGPPEGDGKDQKTSDLKKILAQYNILLQGHLGILVNDLKGTCT